MCTAVTSLTKDFYFGRNLDYEKSFGECIAISPRNHVFGGNVPSPHYAMIGMAHVENGYPLYYDGVNEKGLCMAGLNFVGNAAYAEADPRKPNIAQFELIPAILGSCARLEDARKMIASRAIVGTAFSDALPAAELHWMIADRSGCITVESMRDGVHVYDNPAGVLTNNPPFPMQMFALNDYMGLSPEQPHNNFSDKLDLKAYSRGMGAIGLPGDLSSRSRFVRAAFVRANSKSGTSERESVSRMFHILGSVEQQRGCCVLDNGEFELTLYSCCINADQGIYYYTGYDDRTVRSVDMHGIDLNGNLLVTYDMTDA